MNKQEDKFFEMFRDSFEGFQPEVPNSIYAGVRKKMMWSNFMTFNLSTLNVWYVGLILLGGLGTMGYVSFETAGGQMTAQHEALIDFQAPQIADNQNVEATTPEFVAPVFEIANKHYSAPAQKPVSNECVSTDDDNETRMVVVNDDDLETPPAPEIKTEVAEVQQMEVIKPDVVVFSLENAKMIEMNDLVSQIENPTSGEITFKLPVLLPATDE